MKIIYFSVLTIFFAGCTTQQARMMESQNPTHACRNYQAMMTAPMEPKAVAMLKQKCDESILKNSASHQ